MRRILSFSCKGARLAATLDEAPGKVGLLIVSGGNEIRIGAHRGMARLARDVAESGQPVFRFDRRGIGDSEGENGGFTSSGPDLEAAVAAFKAECPAVTRIIAFGNCDAASALILHHPGGVDGVVLANIWVIEPVDDLPPTAAIKARYLDRVRDPKAWLRLFTGAVNLRKLASGLLRLAQPQAPSGLSHRVADGMAAFPGPMHILLAERDGTALAFADEWQKPEFERVRARADVKLTKLDSGSHSFASNSDYAALKVAILAALS